MGEFGVSRTVVREAISASRRPGSSRPSRSRLVRARPPETTQFSVQASQIRSHRDIVDMIELRLGLEVEAAGLAAARRTEHQLKAIERALLEYKRIGENPNKGVEADYTFHVKVAAASGNRFISDLLTSLGPMMIMLPRTRLKPAYTISDASHFTRVTLRARERLPVHRRGRCRGNPRGDAAAPVELAAPAPEGLTTSARCWA